MRGEGGRGGEEEEEEEEEVGGRGRRISIKVFRGLCLELGMQLPQHSVGETSHKESPDSGSG